MKLGTLTRTVSAVLIFSCVLATLATYPHSVSAISAATGDVEIWVEGPWAYADDPRPGQKGRIVLIAPVETKISHTPPAVGHRTGDYELMTQDWVLEIKNFMRNPQMSVINAHPADVDKQALTTLLDKGADRYVISLPQPDFYEEAVKQEGRAHSTWWDDCLGNCGPQPARTTQMILHYTVSSLDGFSLGPPAQKPISLSFQDRHVIKIFMTPKGEMDDCDSGGRLAFRELVRLFSLTLYVDLRAKGDDKYPSDDKMDRWFCLTDDPQNPANNDAQKPTYKITRSLAGALDDLADYILVPDRKRAEQARADWNQVRRARNLVSGDDKRKKFTDSIVTLDSFLTSLEGEAGNKTQVLPIDALISLKTARTLIPFHNGSGACRNPLLKLNPK